ncbi:FAD-dependent oxidoreductase [Gordonia rubripertincta]|uniref:FAD-dependent oxidoreductase n=1 Tax=Gordonia rubripertincta TaxID=36822 RepID=A0AAW4G3F1_GORRU|nr:FAD-dependent oxidoreductase [Gordonia rubripertincta]MBM7277928.1 FAD-dependent oxidoreductase [Gordonia rubripertincta]QMU23243.1 FAD-dependent oxidoreductase [Gordonia rubripertincta]
MTSSHVEWTLEADVVVAGLGVAGATAAIEAARAGADVLALERLGGGGGAAAMSGGFIYLGGGTALQKSLGFDDSVENMKAFMKAALGPGVDEAKVDVYCEGSVEHYDWLVDAGVVFDESFWGEPGWEPPHGEGLMYSGGENSAPFNTTIPPAPRGHLPRRAAAANGEQAGGYMLMKPLLDLVDELGVRTLYNNSIRSLVVDDDGRVVGVVSRSFGNDMAIRARRGVVLATGSFAYDNTMLRDHAPQIEGRPAASIESHDGRSILLGQALGAATAHMDATEVAIFCDPQLMARGILVNGRGQRFVTEDTYPGRIGQATLLNQGGEAFLIIDEASYEEALATESTSAKMRAAPKWVCESVSELESEMGLPSGSLSATVELYNTHAADGTDPLFGKKSQWLKPISTPVAAYDLRGMTGGFTLGGLKTTVDSEVLHVSGAPIAGLYAAGRCTSGVCAGGYASGASLGDGSFFGRRAGVSSAAAG